MMKKLVIDRSKWRTGQKGLHSTGKGPTALLNTQGFMCCLGFECLRMGIPEDQIRDEGVPNRFDEWKAVDPDWISTAIELNDTPSVELDRSKREKLIEEHFAKINVQVTFEGEYVEPTSD